VSWESGGRTPRLTDLYRIAVVNMINPAGERTHQPSLIPPGFGHVNTVNSYAFRSSAELLAVAASWASVPVDFFVKSTGAGHFQPNQALGLPVVTKHRSEAFVRTLALNCLTRFYADLWAEAFQSDFKNDSWTKVDPRLPKNWFASLTKRWSRSSALRTDFARRQALIELDVLVAMAIGMSLNELLDLYRAQFPNMRSYDRDTWYDRNGRIVFTNSKGLVGVGLDRTRKKDNVGDPVWEEVRHQVDGFVELAIEDDTMPGGPVKRKVVYEAPFDRCDREADYAQAWAEFKRRGL